MDAEVLRKIRRGLRKPPHVIARRLLLEARRSWDRLRVRLGDQGVAPGTLLAATGAGSISELWDRLAARPYFALRSADGAALETWCPGERSRILAAAERALAHRAEILGSGEISLGDKIDWHRDYKTGHSWPKTYAHDLDYVNFDRPSDVKVPWEISRLQWLLPAGQAYLLTGQERYAAAVREVLEQWLDDNPVLVGVNWACTMEVALRIISWTWFFHVLGRSTAWSDGRFRARLLCAIYAHGLFTEQYLEYSEINGNHCTADAAALAIAGLFFGRAKAAERWLATGWSLLEQELPKQVTSDGVDFEGSIAYHRLVLELFLLPAMYRQAHGLDVPAVYRERLVKMARFVRAYSRTDGSSPLVGDADDGRALPLGTQPLSDHRYLVGLVGLACDDEELRGDFAGPAAEVWWLLGADGVRQLNPGKAKPAPRSQAFPDGGYYALRNQRDHVFIDCAPVGQGGRGGHGHNDCLSFEAQLDGVQLVSDCGAYVYTASPRERNLFRATATHNTPAIMGEELNRFFGPRDLWTLRYDAVPRVERWQPGDDSDLLIASHAGYERLDPPLRPVRSWLLDHRRGALAVRDEFLGAAGPPRIFEIPLHLALGVVVQRVRDDELRLQCGQRRFSLVWQTTGDWQLEIGKGRVSPSYGIVRPIVRLAWRCRAGLPAPLLVVLAPDGAARPTVAVWQERLSQSMANPADAA